MSTNFKRNVQLVQQWVSSIKSICPTEEAEDFDWVLHTLASALRLESLKSGVKGVPRAVVADDDDFFRAVVIKALGKTNTEVVGEADNGSTAFELCRSLNPDWLLTDYQMPGLNGCELVKRVRDYSERMHITVFSSVLDEPLKACFNDFNVELFIEKCNCNVDGLIQSFKKVGL